MLPGHADDYCGTQDWRAYVRTNGDAAALVAVFGGAAAIGVALALTLLLPRELTARQGRTY